MARATAESSAAARPPSSVLVACVANSAGLFGPVCRPPSPLMVLSLFGVFPGRMNGFEWGTAMAVLSAFCRIRNFLVGRLGNRESAFRHHAREDALARCQLAEAAALDDAAVVEHQNFVGVGDGRQAM